MKLAFDVIGDLYLTDGDEFDWHGHPTSLYCIITGNISNDISVLKKSIHHLSKYYHGIFYIGGPAESIDTQKMKIRNGEISRACSGIKNVVNLHNQVAIVDGVAIVGVNGWNGVDYKQNTNPENTLGLFVDILLDKLKISDHQYLTNTIERLQLHNDVKTIIVVSSTVPAEHFYFGNPPSDINSHSLLTDALDNDTEKKVKFWLYGNVDMCNDSSYEGVRYINNAKYNKHPYWPHRLVVDN